MVTLAENYFVSFEARQNSDFEASLIVRSFCQAASLEQLHHHSVVFRVGGV